MKADNSRISVVIPARNKAIPLAMLLTAVRHRLPDAEVIVINDGSTDTTRAVAEAADVRVISHPYPMGRHDEVHDTLKRIENSRRMMSERKTRTLLLDCIGSGGDVKCVGQ